MSVARIDLPCGHAPGPLEGLRTGGDHWCPTCGRWYGPGMPLSPDAAHLIDAHHVTPLPPSELEVTHTHELLHVTGIGCDHDHRPPPTLRVVPGLVGLGQALGEDGRLLRCVGCGGWGATDVCPECHEAGL